MTRIAVKKQVFEHYFREEKDIRWMVDCRLFMCSWNDEYNGPDCSDRVAKVGNSATCSFSEEADDPGTDAFKISLGSWDEIIMSVGSGGFISEAGSAPRFSSRDSKKGGWGSKFLCLRVLLRDCTVCRKRRFWK